MNYLNKAGSQRGGNCVPSSPEVPPGQSSSLLPQGSEKRVLAEGRQDRAEHHPFHHTSALLNSQM